MKTALFVLIGVAALWTVDQFVFGGTYTAAAMRMATAMRSRF